MYATLRYRGTCQPRFAPPLREALLPTGLVLPCWALAHLGALLAACAVHASRFDAGPFAWLLEKWGYNVVLVGSGLACLARGVTSAPSAPRG